jgi:peroxiredoxin
MKKTIILILSIALFACTQQPEGYKINVNLEGAEGQIILEKRGASAWIPVDTADVVDGLAVLEGKVDIPGDHYLSVMGQRNKALIFVENAEITFTGKVDSLNFAEITGSATHDEYKVLSEQLKTYNDSYQELVTEYRSVAQSNDTTRMKEIQEEAMSIRDEMDKTQADFVKENPASYVSPFLLSQLQYGLEVEELDEMVTNLDPKFDSVQSIISLKERIAKLKTVAVGQIAPDFTQNDIEGNPVTFSDIYSQNELTLLDFWAAWCGPCRQENPNIVAVFNDFKDQGFNVFGVSLDREKDAWLKAIEDDNLTWAHVSDLGYWQNAAAQLYAVQSIPHSLLVDKTGKIIAKNKRDEELREAVAEYFAN